MIDLNPSRNPAARPRAGCFLVQFLLAAWLAMVTPLRAENPPTYVFQIDASAVPGGFFPISVALDSSNNLYVTDGNNRVQKFTSRGNYLTQWGSSGNGNGQFSNPEGIAVDSSNDVYVADLNNRVEKFTSSGNYLTQWGSGGSGTGQFNGPAGIAVDSSNNIYVADANNNRVEKFESNGSYLTQWGSFGSANGQFESLSGVAVDSSNNVYVTDANRVKKFDSSGNNLTPWGAGSYPYEAYGVAVDSSNNVYVTYFNVVQKFDSNGNYLTQWGGSGSGNGQFSNAGGVAVDSTGNFIYVADGGNDRIQVFVNNTNIIPPFITQQPTNQTVLAGIAGINVAFSVSVVGAAPLACQWTSNNVAVPGATNATLTLTNVNLSESGTYAVLVTNKFGSALSSAVLAVLPALVTTQPASGISAAGAALNGSVTVGPDETVVWFDWGTDTNYGNIAGATIVPGNSGSNSISAALSGLSGNFYHHRIVAANDFGIVYGDDQSFTVGFAPTTITLAAVNSTNGSTLNAIVNPNGWDTTVYFQWGTPTLTNSTPGMDIGAGATSLNVSSFIPGLPPFAPYQYRVVASNALGTVLGEVVSWTPPFVSVPGEAGVVFTGFHSFSRNDGAVPNGLVQGSDGSFYGTTYGGGSGTGGTVFKMGTNGVLTTLFYFVPTFGYPKAGLVQGSDGAFYGTTSLGPIGGYPTSYRFGSVFQISTNGALNVLRFFSGFADGQTPVAALVQATGSDLNFYGTTEYGGGHTFIDNIVPGFGNLFVIRPNGPYWALTGFYSFTGTNDGAYPVGGLVQGSDGNFYGTTRGGGTNGWGTVFQFSPNGGVVSLYSFGTDTNMNGDPVDGANPQAGLVQGSDANFYGTTYTGGAHNLGTVFQIGANGVLRSLHSFSGTNDGAGPVAGLVQGNDGTFYGTTSGGGSTGNGTVFAFNTSRTGFTTLYSFSAGSTNSSGVHTNSDGANPKAGLVLSGNTLYGTASAGGNWGYGTVFSLTLPEPPQLTITHSGAHAIVTWPTNAARYSLQSTTNLASTGVWATNSPAPVVVNGQNAVTNLISGAQQFFRLTQ